MTPSPSQANPDHVQQRVVNNQQQQQQRRPASDSDSATGFRILSDSEREEIYDALINEAPYVPGDFEPPVAAENISWYNQRLVRKGQQFVKRNFFSIILAHVGALLYGFAFKRLSSVLLRTGHSQSVDESIVRYLSTFSHFKTWYEADIQNIGDKGYNDIQRVRWLHRNALRKYHKATFPTTGDLNPSKEKSQLIEAVQMDLRQFDTAPIPQEIITYFPKVPMSQFDMVMTQFGLVSLVFLFPDSLGVSARDAPSPARGGLGNGALDGFFHLWALYGRMLGIMDKYNIALYPDRELYRRIFLNIGIRSLKETDLAVMTLQKTFIDGISTFTLFGSIKSYIYHGLCSPEALPEFEGRCIYGLMSWQDKFYFESLQLLIFIYQKFNWFRICTNFMARVLLNFFFKTYNVCPFSKSLNNSIDAEAPSYKLSKR